jgi:hypothetical protein
MRDVHAWAWWNPVVASAKWLSGEPWAVGSKLRLELARPKLMFEPVVTESAPPNLTHWQGGSLRCSGEQRFIFESQSDGITTIRATLQLAGAAVLLTTTRDAQKALDTWLESLKLESEKLAREEAAHSAA